jgi:hypothetical protein
MLIGCRLDRRGILYGYASRMENQLPNVTPEPKPSTNIPIWAAKETSDQNITENAAANTKNMIAKASNLFRDLICFSPFLGLNEYSRLSQVYGSLA